MELLVINGHDYSQYIKKTGYGWSRNDIDGSNATRTKVGRMRRDKIGTKRKITYEAMGLTRAQLAQLDEDLSEEIFTATFMDLHGQMTREFYCTSFEADLTTTRRDDENTWSSHPFSIIEV